MLLLLIAAGGFIGAVARYRVGGWVHARAGGGFPWGTLAVNLSGSFLLGLLLPLLDLSGPTPGLRAFLTVGLLGAFTTFSTFAYEAVMLADDGEYGRAAAYVGLSLGLGLVVIAAGFAVARAVI
jgi:fluoride exporter